MDLVGRFRIGERLAVVLAGIAVVLCGAVFLLRFLPPEGTTEKAENLNDTAPSFRQDLPAVSHYNNSEAAQGVSTTVIYLDVLIAVNWLIDFLLLRACSRLLRIPGGRGRQVFGSLFGGFCACVILLPSLAWWGSLAVNLVTAGVMCLIAFPWRGIKAYLRQTGALFAVSALLAGVALALFMLIAPAGLYVANGTVYYNVPPVWLAALCGVSYVLICLYERFLRKGAVRGGRYRITVTDAGGTVTLPALYDSGNRLCETFSGAPVIVVQKEAVLPVLSPAMRRTLNALDGTDSGQPAEGAMAVGWRLIPFHSIGGNGLLPAFKPAALTLQRENGKPHSITGCYLALSPALGRGEYQALIGNDPVALSEETGHLPAQKGEKHELVT